jgi:hypothetical protein
METYEIQDGKEQLAPGYAPDGKGQLAPGYAPDGKGQVAPGYAPDEMRTGDRTGAAKLKWVVIVDRSLSPGQAVNAAVCVSAATSPEVPGLLGPGGPDAADQWHAGLPWAGCSILAATSAQLTAIRQQAIDRHLLAADMPAAAQATRVYDDYLAEVAKTHPDDLALLAISLIGPRNQVAKLVRHLELLP